MILFGVDTTDRTASAALMQDGAVIDTKSITETRRHAETVAPMMEEMLRQNGISPSDVDYFAVDVGPGSFTGVRIGVCLVNALAFAADRKVIAVDSLKTLAVGAHPLSERICALIDAGNGNAYAAQYEAGVCVEAPEAVCVAEYLPRIRENMTIIGSGAGVYRDLLLEKCPACTLAPDAYAMPRADAVLLAAWDMLVQADRMAKPMYLRPSQAERMFQKRMEEAAR